MLLVVALVCFICNLWISNGAPLVISDICLTAGNGTACCESLTQQCRNSTQSDVSCTTDPNTGDINSLTLQKCQFAGIIPTRLTYMTSLSHLDLSDNEFIGEIPGNIGNLTNLIYLDLSSNVINGTIPPSIRNITKLKELILTNNKISKMSSLQIATLTNLVKLDLSANKITDNIDAQFSTLTKLRYLDLGDNEIESSIPSELSSLKSMQVFSLHNNYIEGSLPSFLSNFSNLTTALLDYNEFSGYIPDTYGLAWGDSTDGTINNKKLDTIFLGHNDDLYCPVTDYSTYGKTTDYIESYGTNGSLNCAPAPTASPTEGSAISETGLDGVEIALIVLMIIFILGLVAYCWRERRNPSRYMDLGDDAL